MKRSSLKNSRDLLIRNGIATVSYHAGELSDIVHPFSVPGYELLSEGFVSFLEHCRVLLPANIPIVMQIEGGHFSEGERDTIERAIRTHFCLNLSSALADWRACLKKFAWYFIFTLLSSLLLFLSKRVSDEVLTQIIYLPFWFFGYRLVGHLVLDSRPVLKTLLWYRDLAAMKLVFVSDCSEALPPDADAVRSERKTLRKTALAAVKGNGFVNDYLMDSGTVSLECRVSSPEDILSPNYPSSLPFLSESMALYLLQALPFIRKNSRVELEINGGDFTPEEQEMVRGGILRYFEFRKAQEDSERETNRAKVLFFAIFMTISMVLLGCWGVGLDVAAHEFIVMVFWFFGDYLLEFILLNPRSIRSEHKKFEVFADMTVKFHN